MDNQYQFPNQPHQQPSYQQPIYFQGQRPPKPNNHLAWAILSTIFCCLPLGIVSIVYSSKVDGLYNAGDIKGAYDAASKASSYAMWGTIIGLICILCGVCVGGI